METKSAAMKDVIRFHKQNWKKGDDIPEGFMLDAFSEDIIPIAKNPDKQRHFVAGGDARLKSIILGVLRGIRPLEDIPERAQTWLNEGRINFAKQSQYAGIVDKIRKTAPDLASNDN